MRICILPPVFHPLFFPIFPVLVRAILRNLRVPFPRRAAAFSVRASAQEWVRHSGFRKFLPFPDEKTRPVPVDLTGSVREPCALLRASVRSGTGSGAGQRHGRCWPFRLGLFGSFPKRTDTIEGRIKLKTSFPYDGCGRNGQPERFLENKF